jgi:spore coat protein A
VLKPIRADASTDYFEMETRPAEARILPGLSTGIWGFNGVFPGPTIETRMGRTCNLRLRNMLPVPMVNHLHGGATPSLSDGYPTDFIMPVQDSPARQFRMHAGREVAGEREYIYPNGQPAAMLWYHDHRMDYTGAQVWRGLAGLYVVRDEQEDRLPLPRDEKEIPLVICDRSFAADGSFIYPSIDPSLAESPGVAHHYMGGVLGEVVLVNGVPWPRHEVSNTRYRLRVLNASNARRYELALGPSGPPGPSFIQIGSDSGLLDAPLGLKTVRVAPAERFDLIVDFSRYPVGSTVDLINLASSGPAANVMRFHVVRNEKDESAVPARLSASREIDPREATTIREFDFRFQRGPGIWTINGKPFDEARADATPKLDSVEIWRLRSDFNHPIHLHLVHFRVLSHGGPAGRWDAGWKDTIDLEPGQAASILMRFSGFRGKYVFHCHNLEHEDMAMMGNFEVV